MKILLFLAPSLLVAAESFVTDIPSSIPKHTENFQKPSFNYVNPGVTTWVPILFETKVHSRTPGLPGGKTRNSTINDKLEFVIPDVSFGTRSLFTHHVFDRSIGIAAQPAVQVLYVQGSYLFFPTPSEKFYFGAGLTLGIYHISDRSFYIPSPFIYANLPITLGYQFPSDKNFQFIQLQVTPFGTGTLSYGYGF